MVGKLAEKARAIRLVLTDCDGVLTDGGVRVALVGSDFR